VALGGRSSVGLLFCGLWEDWCARGKGPGRVKLEERGSKWYGNDKG
jgi:hypothetical protein